MERIGREEVEHVRRESINPDFLTWPGFNDHSCSLIFVTCTTCNAWVKIVILVYIYVTNYCTFWREKRELVHFSVQNWHYCVFWWTILNWSVFLATLEDLHLLFNVKFWAENSACVNKMTNVCMPIDDHRWPLAITHDWRFMPSWNPGLMTLTSLKLCNVPN